MRSVRTWILGYSLILSVTLLAAHWGSRAVTVMAENTPPKRSHTIIIDAGHGGVDGGAVSCTGMAESQLNLQISLRLEDLLRFLGHDTRMIRREDISVYTKGETIAARKASDLKERVRICNERENALLLSIHQNNFPESRYSGAQVFYNPGAEDLAKQLQSAFVATLNPGSHRQAKKSSGVYLMEHISCPGVLIECGFLSNPAEEYNLRSDGYQKQIAAVIGCTVSGYLSNT